MWVLSEEREQRACVEWGENVRGTHLLRDAISDVLNKHGKYNK